MKLVKKMTDCVINKESGNLLLFINPCNLSEILNYVFQEMVLYQPVLTHKLEPGNKKSNLVESLSRMNIIHQI